MTNVARSAAAGHAGHGFARALAKNETPAEGFDALMASLAGGAASQAPIDVAHGGHERERGRDANARDGADATVSATLNVQDIAGVAQALAAANALHARGSLAAVEEADEGSAAHAARPLPVATSASSATLGNIDPKSTVTMLAQDARARNAVLTAGDESASRSSDNDAEAGAISARPRDATSTRSRTAAAGDAVTAANPFGRAATRANSGSADDAPTGVAPTRAAVEGRATFRAPPSDDVRAAMAELFEPKRDARLPTTTPAPPSRLAIDIARERQHALAETTLSTLGASPMDDPATTFSTLIAMRKADASLNDRADAHDAIDSIATPSASWNAPAPGSASNGAASSAATNPASPSFDPTAWSAALARQVASGALAAAREASVTFEPRGLGPIEVRVRVDAQRVDVRFAIEHPVTVNLVRDALPDLEKMLAQSGMTLGDANVAQQQASGGGRQAFAAAASTSLLDRDDDMSIAAAAEARPRARAGLLDDFV